MCCNPCSWCSHLVWCAWVCCKGYINIWCGVHRCVARVTSTFGVACIGVLQGLHQHLVWRAQACCKVYIINWCSVHEHVARVTSTFGAACMGVLRKGYIHSWCSVCYKFTLVTCFISI